jgi:hypothetical protein
MTEDEDASPTGLTREQAQKMLDYVADRLDGTDREIAERMLEGFVDRLRGLDDIAKVRRLIEEGDETALAQLGGVQGARRLVCLVEKIAEE